MSDLETLHDLNRDYIASVQNGDVRRFDEILAADFYCSNPDGTLIDRAASWSGRRVPSPSATCKPGTCRSAGSATPRSSMPARLIRYRTAAKGLDATRMSGSANPANGGRYRPT